MNYYIDTEFIDGKQPKKLLGITYGSTPPLVDLISIGIVCEDGRNFYAVSKEFNLEYAWNKCEVKVNPNYSPKTQDGSYNPKLITEYWLRENVLRPIYNDYLSSLRNYEAYENWAETKEFTYSAMSIVIAKVGLERKVIAEYVRQFMLPSRGFIIDWYEEKEGKMNNKWAFEVLVAEIEDYANPSLFGWYSAYDFLALCQLYNKMLDIPKGMPRYVSDLKAMEVQKLRSFNPSEIKQIKDGTLKINSQGLKYPTKRKVHHALGDAQWILDLHKFLNALM